MKVLPRIEPWAIRGHPIRCRAHAGCLATSPHWLVGGTTGSAKSVCLHSLILSLLQRHKPETLQLALIDPKQVEFAL
jgi:DNA segregation ATPase FtsK/SpoIIIE-like protein